MPYNLMEEYKVKDDVYKILSKECSPQFGKVAVNLGFVTEKQLTEVMNEQIKDVFSNKPHRFIGSILFEHGWITRDQLDFVVLRLFKQEELTKLNPHST